MQFSAQAYASPKCTELTERRPLTGSFWAAITKSQWLHTYLLFAACIWSNIVASGVFFITVDQVMFCQTCLWWNMWTSPAILHTVCILFNYWLCFNTRAVTDTRPHVVLWKNSQPSSPWGKLENTPGGSIRKDLGILGWRVYGGPMSWGTVSQPLSFHPIQKRSAKDVLLSHHSMAGWAHTYYTLHITHFHILPAQGSLHKVWNYA